MPEEFNQDLPYWVALAHCPKLGAARFALLRRGFSTMAEVWQAKLNDLLKTGLDESTSKDLIKHREQAKIETYLNKLSQLNIKVVNILSEHYPKLLKEIYDPPPVLFYQGDLDIINKNPALAVVGTRQATSYGSHATENIVGPLASAGLVIISGLAYGIDTIAHQITLKNKGLTAAVLGSGLDNIYPIANQQLAHNIVAGGGVLLTEFPPGTKPLKQNFPYRNRIIAGLARGTLVIEAAPGSGSLITAKHALEANREVFSIPGSIFSEHSKGTNELIKLGAHPITEAQEILNVFGLEAIEQKPLPPLATDQQNTLNLLTKEPQPLDEIVRAANQTASEIMAKLTILEISGYAREVGGQKWVRLV